MLKLMQKKALQLYVEAEKGGESGSEVSSSSMIGESPVEDSTSGSKVDIGVGDLKVGVDDSGSNSDGGVGLGSRGKRLIEEKLATELSSTELQVEDISYQHAGHAGVRGIVMVRRISMEFDGKSLVKRHRPIYDLLEDELQSGLHALSIVAKTPSEVDGR